MAEKPLDEQAFKKFLGDVLNNRIPVITELADLPSLWRDTSSGEPDPDHPGFPNRAALLYTMIGIAGTQPWAREGLRRLLVYLSKNGEGIPQPLGWWVIHQYACGGPPPKRGRPKESDRDFRVSVVYLLLRHHGYSREEAFDLIAELIYCEPETIRSIIRKFEKALASR